MDKKLFNDLTKGLQEIIAYKDGKLQLTSEIFEVIKPPKNYKAKDIKRIRAKERCSQYSFAKVLNISIKTVQAWESGQRKPSGIALRMLEIIDKGMYVPLGNPKAQ